MDLGGSLSLSGKTALVCGGSSGIGESTVRLFAERGARVIVLARSEQKMQDLISSLPGAGHKYFVADLSDITSLDQKILPQLQKEGIQILVNNSGGPKGGPLLEAALAEFSDAFRAHLLASHCLSQGLVPAMKNNGYGRIINIISTSVKTPLPGLGVSNTIRGAMANWSKTLAMELGSYGITVNNVLPGYIKTDRLLSLLSSAAEKDQKDISTVEQTWIEKVPLGRIGLASEVAEVISFLASPAASYVTGVNLPVDGGRTPTL